MCVAMSAALDQEDRDEKGWVTHAQVCRILRHLQLEFSIAPQAMKRIFEAFDEHKRLLAPGEPWEGVCVACNAETLPVPVPH